MKMPWDYMFDWLYSRYVNKIKENLELKQKLLENKLIIHEPSFELGNQTESDKPSPSSSLSRDDMLIRLKRAFPELRFSHFTVEDTNSMEPYIDDNCIVVVENVDDKFKLKKGQIIIYSRLNPIDNKTLQFVIHRIISVSNNEKSFYIKGDNNFFADGWINIDKIRYNLVNIGYFNQDEEGD